MKILIFVHISKVMGVHKFNKKPKNADNNLCKILNKKEIKNDLTQNVSKNNNKRGLARI